MWKKLLSEPLMYSAIALSMAGFLADGTVQMAVDLDRLEREARYSQWEAEWERVCGVRKASQGTRSTAESRLPVWRDDEALRPCAKNK